MKSSRKSVSVRTPSRSRSKSKSKKSFRSASMKGVSLLQSLSRRATIGGDPDDEAPAHHFATPIPQGREAWLDYLCWMVKTKRTFTFLPDREIKKTLSASRRVIAKEFSRNYPSFDPRLPLCFYWNVTQVGEWLDSVGLGQLKAAFQNNFITGRRLINIDASALSKMGMRYFDDIKNATAKIRELLQIHPANMMRAIIRRVPWNEYLTKRGRIGNTYDLLTFKKFCFLNGFPYTTIKHNPCALIACSTQILIQESIDGMQEDISDAESEHSIVGAPSVEFHVRHMIVRNRVVDEIIELLIECAFARPLDRKYGDKTLRLIKQILESGFIELNLSQEEIEARIEFGRLVADEMVQEAKRTQRVLSDIKEFKKYMQDTSVSPGELEEVRNICAEFYDAASLVAGLTAVAETDIEKLFRKHPMVQDFVDGVTEEARRKIEEQLPLATAIVEDVLDQAKLKILAMNFPTLSEKTVKKARDLAIKLVEIMIDESIHNSKHLYFPYNAFEIALEELDAESARASNKSIRYTNSEVIDKKGILKQDTREVIEQTQRSKIQSQFDSTRRQDEARSNANSGGDSLKLNIDAQPEIYYVNVESGYRKDVLRKDIYGWGESESSKESKNKLTSPHPQWQNFEGENKTLTLQRAISKSKVLMGRYNIRSKIPGKRMLSTRSDSKLYDDIKAQDKNTLFRNESVADIPSHPYHVAVTQSDRKVPVQKKISLLNKKVENPLSEIQKESDEEGYAQFIRITADQVTHDALQKAFHELLGNTESEEDSSAILEILEKLKNSGSKYDEEVMQKYWETVHQHSESTLSSECHSQNHRRSPLHSSIENE